MTGFDAESRVHEAVFFRRVGRRCWAPHGPADASRTSCRVRPGWFVGAVVGWRVWGVLGPRGGAHRTSVWLTCKRCFFIQRLKCSYGSRASEGGASGGASENCFALRRPRPPNAGGPGPLQKPTTAQRQMQPQIRHQTSYPPNCTEARHSRSCQQSALRTHTHLCSSVAHARSPTTHHPTPPRPLVCP